MGQLGLFTPAFIYNCISFQLDPLMWWCVIFICYYQLSSFSLGLYWMPWHIVNATCLSYILAFTSYTEFLFALIAHFTCDTYVYVLSSDYILAYCLSINGIFWRNSGMRSLFAIFFRIILIWPLLLVDLWSFCRAVNTDQLCFVLWIIGSWAVWQSC